MTTRVVAVHHAHTLITRLAARGAFACLVAAALLALGIAVGVANAVPRTQVGSGAGSAPPAPAAIAQEADAGLSARQVFLPAMNFIGSDDHCSTWIGVQNIGDEPTKVVLLAWGAATPPNPAQCKGPIRAECTGIISPGSTWSLRGNQIPTGSVGGALFSFSTRRFSDFGPTRYFDRPMADAMCEMLSAEDFLGDCGQYAAFKHAYDTGGVFRGAHLDEAGGGPLAVHVQRDCLSDRSPGVRASAAYGGVGYNAVGEPDAQRSGYGYHVLPFALQYPERSSITYIQNAGIADAAVEVWARAAGECGEGTLCHTGQIVPGQVVPIVADDCVPDGWRGRLWVRGSQPLAIVTDELGEDMLITHNAIPPTLSHDATGQPALNTDSRALFGPLLYDPHYGWETEVTVVNLSETDAADVTVEFIDPAGESLDAFGANVCPGGEATLTLPMIDDRPGARVGSIRVVSRPPSGDPSAEAAPIGAVAILTKWSDLGRNEAQERVAYNLTPEGLALRWPAGGGAGDTDGGVAVVAVPKLFKTLDNVGVTSELVLTNYVPQPGWTDVAVIVYDQNGLIDAMCRRLNAGEVDYIDLQTSGAYDNGFIGAAVVSATFWEHPVPGGGGPARNLVAIGAASVLRERTRIGSDVPGDETSVALGVPLRRLPGTIAASAGNPCAPEPDPDLTPPEPPSSLRPESLPAQVFLPTLTYIGQDDRCSAAVELRNEGTTPTKILLMRWPESRFCPPDCARMVGTCSGLLAPGASWTVTEADFGGEFQSSAIAYSLSTKTLDETGIEPGDDTLVADRVCASLALPSVRYSCFDHIQFRRAFTEGLSYDGIPMHLTYGPAISGDIERGCPDKDTAGQRNTSRYDALRGTDVYVRDPMDGTYWYSVVPAYADRAYHDTLMYVQNAGFECTDVEIRFRASGDCLRARVGRVLALAPGETAPVEPWEFIGPQFLGFAMIHGSQPLAVSADVVAPDVQRSFVAVTGRSPFDINGDGAVDGLDIDALDAALGTTPGDARWNPRADLDANGLIDEDDRDWLQKNLCGRGVPALPDPPPTDPRSADVVLLPVLDPAASPSNLCDGWVAAQNVGDAPAKGVLLTWATPWDVQEGACTGPADVSCTGLLRPGRSWHMPVPDTDSPPTSAMLFSFNTLTLDALGIAPGSDKAAADHMCDVLVDQVLGDCDAYARFKSALDTGGDFAGVPLDRVAGSPMAARVERRCLGGETPGVRTIGSYAGIGTNRLGVRDALRGGYVYYAPIAYGDKASFESTLSLQNAGAEPAEVSVIMHAQDDCGNQDPWWGVCPSMTIQAGERARIVASDCTGPQWQGNAIVTSSQPLGVVVETAGRDGWFDYTATPARVDYDAGGRGLLDTPNHVLYGPLVYDSESGWDVGVQVANLSETQQARVRVEFRDVRGAISHVFEDSICVSNTQTYFKAVDNADDTLSLGSVRVVSVRPPDVPAIEPAPIAGLVTMIRYSDRTRTHLREAASYNLLPEPLALDWPVGSGAGGLESGVGVVSLPDVRLDPAGTGTTTEIAVTNLVGVPGWTDVAVIVYDQNHIVDVDCRRIDAGRVDTVDLSSLGLSPGFRGGAVVSATVWDHETEDPDTGAPRNVVGIGAVALNRVAPAGPGTTQVDPLGMAIGQPLRALPWPAGEEPGNLCDTIPTREPTPTPAATRTPGATPTPLPAHSIYLPAAYKPPGGR